MKKTLKKYVTFLLAFLMMVSAFGNYLPDNSKTAKVQAAEPSGNPAYMAKLKGTHVDGAGNSHSWVRTYQTMGANPGTTYQLSFDYYVEESSSADSAARAILWTGMADPAVKKIMMAGTKGTMEMTYTAQEGESWLGIGFESEPNAVCYITNVSLKAKDSDTELLQNADFTREGGSWIGWAISGNAVSDKAGSDTLAATYGHEILPLDTNLFPKEEEPEVPEGIPTGDPEYMAKLKGTYVDGAGESHSWVWVYQAITPTAGKTYQFTCDYYVPEGDGGRAVLWSATDDNGIGQTMESGKQGTVELSYTAKAGDSYMAVRFQTEPNTTCYVWNACVKEEGGSVNLLTNGSFKKENGSWIGWIVGGSTVTDKAGSDQAVATYGQEILTFDKSLLPKEEEPEVPEGIPTGDPEYMAKLKGTYVDGAGESHSWVWVYQAITPTAGKTYQFTCDYYVPEGDGGRAVLWSATDDNGIGQTMESGKQGTVELSYTAKAGDSYMAVRFQTEPNTTCYVWNACVKEEGGSVNLLTNGSFKKENGSWIGWIVGGSTVTDKAGSDKAVATYGQEILAFNKSLFPGEKVPDKIPTGDPEYMAKLKGTHKAPNGQMYTYVNVMQAITPVAGKTYIFSCNYYDRAADAGASILLWSNTSNESGADANGRLRSRTKAGMEGTLELTYTAKPGDNFIAVSMECDPDSECYMWNLCLREQGSDINLLRNGNFRELDGSWIGWMVGSLTVNTKADSDKLTSTYGQEIVSFSRKLIESMKEEDAALKTYQDPNKAFSFDDVNKYKDMDLRMVKSATVVNPDANAEGLKSDTVKEDPKNKQDSSLGMVIGICVAGILVVGLAAAGTVLVLKKKKSKK